MSLQPVAHRLPRSIFPLLLHFLAGASSMRAQSTETVPPVSASWPDNHHWSVAELLERGRRNYWERNYDQAVDIYQRVLKIDPHNAEALYELAWTYFDMREFVKSLEAVTEATHYDTLNLERSYALISVVFRYDMIAAIYEAELENRSPEDIALYKQSAYASREGSEQFFKLGVGYAVRHTPGDAMKAFIRAVMLRPDYTDAHFSMGKVLEELSRPDLAALAYARALLTSNDSRLNERLLVRLENALRSVEPMEAGDDSVHISPCGSPAWLRHRFERILRVLKPDDTLVRLYYFPWLIGIASEGYLASLPRALYLKSHADIHEKEDDAEGVEKSVAEFLKWDSEFSWFRR